MSILNKIHNRYFVPNFVPSFLLNSLPKSGTHLLQKVLMSFQGIQNPRAFISKGWVDSNQLCNPHNFQVLTIPIGVGSPQLVPVDTIQKSLQALKKGQYMVGHIPYSQGMADLLDCVHMKSILILRDPRDVVLSHTKYLASTKDHFLHNYYQTLSESEQITTSILGIEESVENVPRLLNICDRYQSLCPWISQPFNYTTNFEKLVGVKGGGTDEEQKQELENIARHLGIKYTSNELQKITNRLFGGTGTFRKGTIGQWKECLSKEHKQIFKDVAGQLLIDLGYAKDYDW